ncbi:adenylyltransferase and sulfurtransferase [Marchantia polymorpha subsp. ruderalis]|uniref:Adenylyltransferase and sulfurtransferase MOCS3 n=1 Tax=Marchantia polymorpha TaxID=3197 RepID=A0A2R6XIM6_MARPO|nr:hypothetical protein MARPO_0013s0163 [Marchantia polymorpha]BBN18879.1 hypothetical protein Mp_8g06270 [Marchantia polymorpha subsp. ruderalis]|eukprot:PTQ45965.1 hypothetical protein MARPO_0013s0163 [Marchantia polymorpha]
MGEMDEEDVVMRRISKLKKESVREEMVSRFARIRKEAREFREQLAFQEREEEAENADIVAGCKSDLDGEAQCREPEGQQFTKNTKQKEGDLKSQDPEAKKQEDRRLGSCGMENGSCAAGVFSSGHSMGADFIRRYSRQLLVPSFGVSGQKKLSESAILIVGMGGLGSPISSYLAASGVGRLGLVDSDVVELSNLHRQIIHTEAFIGQPKVSSAASACLALNSSILVKEHGRGLNAANAVEIISQYDVVVDATDNIPSRYLISDACVATAKPLVSGAALGLEGQLSVYNHKSGPCYRCLFPVPPPPGTRQRCSDNGVLGVVPGIIGTLQALEAIKLASGFGETLSSRMLLLDAFSTRIHMVKLRGRSPNCFACGDAPQISAANLHEFDYERFTESTLSEEGPKAQELIPVNDRLSSAELKKLLESGKPHVLLDVRDSHEYVISSLPSSLNIPLSLLKERLSVLQSAVDSVVSFPDNPQEKEYPGLQDVGSSKEECSSVVPSRENTSIYVVCRRGNDSQKAVQFLRSEGFSSAVDVVGGLESWAKDVDERFPFY